MGPFSETRQGGGKGKVCGQRTYTPPGSPLGDDGDIGDLRSDREQEGNWLSGCLT